MTFDLTLQRRLVEHAVAGRYAGMLRTGLLLSVVGGTMFLFAIAGAGAERAWQAFHVNWLFFTGLAGGSLALVAVHKLANAQWSGLVLRFAQATAAFLPIALLGLVLIFTVGYDAIYGHMQEQLHSLPHGKERWLSHPAMFGRLVLALGVLFGVGWSLVKHDLVPDLWLARDVVGPERRGLYAQWTVGFDGTETARQRQRAAINRRAGLYVVLYALGFTLVAFDMIMALQPHWFSNLLGGFYFMASFLGAHTLLALSTLYGERELGIRHLVSAKQRHDLGKLIFGFTVFWAYLMWAQFLVIWYGNLPEETGFVFSRLWGPWRPVAGVVLAGMFLVPFWGLIGVAPKKSRVTLGLFAAVSLVALWIERYLLVLPSITPVHGPPFGGPEIAATLLFTGLFLTSYAGFGRTFPMLSPELAEVTLAREVHHAEVAAEFEHDESPKDYVSEEVVEREIGEGERAE
jgi:hypothetical protein